MKNLSIMVRAFWDDEAQVWVATTSDIDGLSVEAESMELLRVKVLDALSDLIELNGETSNLPEIPVHILTDPERALAILESLPSMSPKPGDEMPVLKKQR